jgi:hypothetical protein
MFWYFWGRQDSLLLLGPDRLNEIKLAELSSDLRQLKLGRFHTGTGLTDQQVSADLLREPPWVALSRCTTSILQELTYYVARRLIS